MKTTEAGLRLTPAVARVKSGPLPASPEQVLSTAWKHLEEEWGSLQHTLPPPEAYSTDGTLPSLNLPGLFVFVPESEMCWPRGNRETQF